MSTWYYVDSTQSRHGPVDAGILTEAYRLGRLTDGSLVWRDGMAEWTPLGQFRDELGLVAPPPGPVAPAAAAVEAKAGKGCLVPGLVIAGGGLVLLFILAILAAIAIPAYQDYLGRSKLSAVLMEGLGIQARVDDFMVNTDRCPRDAQEINLTLSGNPDLAEVRVGEANTGMCTIELVLGEIQGAPGVAGESLLLSRDSGGDWYCTTDIAKRTILPPRCQ